MQKLRLVLVFAMFALSAQAQDGSLFDFQIQKMDSINYEMKIQLSENTNVQYIQIHFLEKGNILEIDEASLNKKRDGNYYLYFNGEEKEVFLDNVEISLSHEFGLLKAPAVKVKLIDKDLNTIDSYQKIID